MISLDFNEIRFENDIRALVMAFFPGERIAVSSLASDIHIRFDFHRDHFNVCFLSRGNKAVVRESGLCEIERNIVKRTVYEILSAYTGKELPWGTLTGIRPTKIVMDLLHKGMMREEIYDYYKKQYLISDEKFNLCHQVAACEKDILMKHNPRGCYSLYIGIPFCPTICAYCSFSSYPLNVWENKVEDYLQALFAEIDYVSEKMSGKRMQTLYMGGGTPTSLSADQMNRLLSKLDKKFSFKDIIEITIEAGRPDSITLDKLKVIKSYGIDRISINPQTMNQKTLDTIGRRHTIGQIEAAFMLAREVGFTNINMDIIVGLPGEALSDVSDTLEKIRALNPDSLTVHSLAVKRAARLNQEGDGLALSRIEEVDQMLALALDAATKMDMRPYYLYRQKNIAGNLENVGYAKADKYGLYNILMMEERQTIIAIGAGATSKIIDYDDSSVHRIENVKSVKDYIERTDEMQKRKEKYLNHIKL